MIKFRAYVSCDSIAMFSSLVMLSDELLTKHLNLINKSFLRDVLVFVESRKSVER